MTAVLQQTTSSSFNTTPGPLSCRLDGPFSIPHHASDLGTASTNTLAEQRSRQSSPVASLFSAASAPIHKNNENISPLAGLRSGGVQTRSASTHSQNSPVCSTLTIQQKSRNFTFQPFTSGDFCLRREAGGEETACAPVAVAAQASGSVQHTISDLVSRDVPLRRPPTRQTDQFTGESKSAADQFIQQRDTVVASETGKLTKVRSLRQQSTNKDAFAESPVPNSTLAHQRRLSDGSSGFVHSMKTASFTNASFSVFPRSSRLGKSSDSYIMHESQPRCSIDSDRPISSSSFDELALKRGFKRQQIIDELIATEDSYVSDLKALVYLYSTLLASTSSIPNRLRTAIEKNVEDILHSHEHLQERLHTVRLQAAARRWADTAVPIRLGHNRRVHPGNSDGRGSIRTPLPHRNTCSDESADLLTDYAQPSGPAELLDVCEITAVFKDAVRGFYSYEEYCANFEAIGFELQKHAPQLWSTYESGMESLARSILAIDQRRTNERKGLTVGDLLIKPIQRLTKYPLLLEQLLHSTPVTDAPGPHAELDVTLQTIRNVVHMVNLAQDNQYARLQVQRRWLLQDRLGLSQLNISAEQFRSLGAVELCGVLHVAYQTSTGINGGYALCALLDEHFLIAFPKANTGRFEAGALVQLSDIKIESAADGKGLQCASTVFTWKISFACAGHYREVILNACSKVEENQWTTGLRGEFSRPAHYPVDSGLFVATCIAMDLKSVGVVLSSSKSLSRESSVQRAATVGGRPSISQVIIRNTHNTHVLSETRAYAASSLTINRSQSHMVTKRIPLLEPKRSERTRLENSISDIWTKERLPFPGMVGSKGGQRIRASAGTLARKLSLASIHTPFSKSRTPSLSMASRKSYELSTEAKSTFESRRPECPPALSASVNPKDIPEVDDMRSVVGRMIGNGVHVLKQDQDTSMTRDRSKRTRKSSVRTIGPDDSAAGFYENAARSGNIRAWKASLTIEADTMSVTAAEGGKRRKRRWSRPISKLKEIGSEAKGILYFNSSCGA